MINALNDISISEITSALDNNECGLDISKANPEVDEPGAGYTPIKYGHEPIRINSDEMDSILKWAAENSVSDVTFRSGEGVWIKHFGKRL